MVRLRIDWESVFVGDGATCAAVCLEGPAAVRRGRGVSLAFCLGAGFTGDLSLLFAGGASGMGMGMREVGGVREGIVGMGETEVGVGMDMCLRVGLGFYLLRARVLGWAVGMGISNNNKHPNLSLITRTTNLISITSFM